MRVLVITNLYPLPWAPEQATFNRQQFDRLADRLDVTVLVAVPWTRWIRHRSALRAPPRDDVPAATVAPRGPAVAYFVYWYVPGLSRNVNVLAFFGSLLLQRLRWIRQGGWHCLLGSWAYPDAVATVLMGRLLGIPVVAKVHGSDLNRVAQPWPRRWQVRLGLAACDRVVAVSRALVDRLRTFGVDADRIRLIYNGVDGARFAPIPQAAARRALDLSDEARLVLFVGNLRASKGCLDLLTAFGRLAGEDPTLSLYFVGDGEAAGTIRRLAREAGLLSRVHLAGTQPHHRIRDWLCAADLLCLPSHAEGVPNVILEAYACGTPVVATRVGGIPEVTPDDVGRLVPPRDPAALADAIRTVLRDPPSADRLCAQAVRFDWDESADQLARALRSAAGC